MKASIKFNVFELFEFVLILLTVLVSKTVYFGIVNYKIYNYIFLFLCLLTLLLKSIFGQPFNLSNVKVFIIFTLILFLVSAVHIVEILSYTSYPKELLTLLSLFLQMMIVSSIVSKNKFVFYYVKIIFVISIISIICYSILLVNPILLAKLHIYSDSQHIYSLYYTWGWTSIQTADIRNWGPFWEPGGFQGFLLIGILFVLAFSQYIKQRRIILITFTITLLTTGSTTAYLLLLILIFTFHKELIKLFKPNSHKLKILFPIIEVFSIILVLATICYIFISHNITTKFSEDNISYNIRTNDLLISFKLAFKYFIAGTGLGFTREYVQEINGIQRNSVGSLYILYNYGCFFGFYYFYRIKKGLDCFFLQFSKKQIWIIFLIFIILHSTEILLWLPLYTAFLYNWSDKRTLSE